MEMRWPSGQTDKLKNVGADQMMTIKEGVGNRRRKANDKEIEKLSG